MTLDWHNTIITKNDIALIFKISLLNIFCKSKRKKSKRSRAEVGEKKLFAAHIPLSAANFINRFSCHSQLPFANISCPFLVTLHSLYRSGDKMAYSMI